MQSVKVFLGKNTKTISKYGLLNFFYLECKGLKRMDTVGRFFCHFFKGEQLEDKNLLPL